jgi:hypothetical protein
MGVYQDRLVLIRAAITEILETGQSVSYAGRNLTLADLKTLQDLEKDTVVLANNETSAQCGAGRSRISYIVPIG